MIDHLVWMLFSSINENVCFDSKLTSSLPSSIDSFIGKSKNY